MKRILPLLAAIFIANIVVAQDADLERQADSAKYALLKPRIEKYLVKADGLNARISATTNKDSIRLYAKQLCHLTDSMLVSADRIYGYSSKSTTYSGVGIVGTAPVIFMVPVTTTTGIRPSVHDALQGISEASDTMRWFTSTKEGRQKKIEKLMAELRRF